MDNNHFNTQQQIAKIRIDTQLGTAKGYFKPSDFKSHRTSEGGLATSFPSLASHTPSSKDLREITGRPTPSKSVELSSQAQGRPALSLQDGNLGHWKSQYFVHFALCEYLGVDYV